MRLRSEGSVPSGARVVARETMDRTAIPNEITRWLRERELADPEAMGSLFAAMYSDLKRRAHSALRRESPGATLNTTGLVNEAYLRLAATGGLAIRDREHFLALASKTMRWVLVDTARARKRLRRGGDAQRVTLDEATVMSEARADELLALDGALERLAAVDPRLGEVVELRYYGGLSVEETAAALAVSPRTVKRDWHKARAFLALELSASSPELPAP